MDDATRAGYEARIAALELELERFRAQPMMTVMGSMGAPRSRGGGAGGATVAGLEEMVLQVGPGDDVSYLNSQMARLLEVPDRKAILRSPLASIDRGPLGEGFLGSLVRGARATGRAQVIERSYEDLPGDRLPATDSPAPACDTVLSFAVTPEAGSVHLVVQDVTRLRWLEATFSRFVSPRVIAHMQQMRPDELLRMERRSVTVLFADMRGFTGLCQEEEPHRVQETVNSFLETMVAQVEELDGTVVGFAGDQVMAMWNAPTPQADHALRGLICGATMQKAHDLWMATRRESGDPVREVGIGLATGEVVVGNIGTSTRMDYTAQGHTVNLAARLCSAAAGGEILTVPQLHSAALGALKTYTAEVPIPRFSFRDKGPTRFKNVADPVRVVSVLIKPSATSG